MSEYTKPAVFAKLTGDAGLAAVLGTEENGNPSVFNADMNQKQQDLAQTGSGWTYPCITFRFPDDRIDPRFRAGIVSTEHLDLEIWASTKSALTIPQIARLVIGLLHQATLTPTVGRVYFCELVSSSLDQYDSKLKAHFGLMRFKLTVGG